MAILPRSQTNLEEVETTPFAHKYMLKRPRLRQASNTDSIDLSTSTSHNGHGASNGMARGTPPSSSQELTIDNPAVEKREFFHSKCQTRRLRGLLLLGRFELFIDLIWAGIISNLAEHFSDQAFHPESTFSVSDAVFEFIILYLIAWRIWKDLQEFMSKYHTHDLVQRLFVVWIIILATLYGNNAPYLLDSRDPSNVAIVIFLVVLASFIVIEFAYSIFLPSLRRELVLRTAFAGLTLSLWIPATSVRYSARAWLLFAAILIEYPMAAFVNTPLAERSLKKPHSEYLDTDHWVERIQDFYIIILGEGVLSLIKGSPLGRGITDKAGTGVSALLAYYVLSAFYFNGDQSRRYVHAVRRTWLNKLLWHS